MKKVFGFLALALALVSTPALADSGRGHHGGDHHHGRYEQQVRYRYDSVRRVYYPVYYYTPYAPVIMPQPQVVYYPQPPLFYPSPSAVFSFVIR